jgi:hypothetical protein
MNQIQTAFKIFRKLIENGQMDREKNMDLFLEFREPGVRAILLDMEEEMEFKIVEVANSIYLIPDIGNSTLGFITKDMKDWIGSNARLADVFLLRYIAMFILYLFYGGKNNNPKQREFIRVSNLVEDLDKRFLEAVEFGENAGNFEERYAVNFIKVGELWASKQGYEENARKTKTGTVISACRLLEKENLIRIIEDDREIRTTKKLDDLMLNYFLNESRVEEINKIFAERGDENAPIE